MKVKATPRPLTGRCGRHAGRDRGRRAARGRLVRGPAGAFSSRPAAVRTLRMLGHRHAALELADDPRAPPSYHPPFGAGRSWSTPACTRRSPRSPPRTSDGSITRFSHAELEPGKDVAAQLRSRGLDARDIKTVVMTHLHFDHASAMSELRAARTSSSPSPSGRPRQRRRARSCTDTRPRTSTTRSTTAPSTSTGQRRLVLDLRPHVRPVRRRQCPACVHAGHTLGHMSVICHLKDRDLVIAGDAIYTLGQLDDAPPPPAPRGSAHLAPLSAGAHAVSAPVPAGRDHPRATIPRPGRARRALRVAPTRASLRSRPPSSWRPAAVPARRFPPSALAASCACSSAFSSCSSASCLCRFASRW